MFLKYSLLIILIAICCCSATIAPQNPSVDSGLKALGIGSRLDISISSYEPTWSHLHPSDETRTLVTVTGCGFSRELYAVCVFDLSFTSYASRIVDDNTLICELPFLEISSFETLPYWSRLDIYWGDHVSSMSESRLGPYSDIFHRQISGPLTSFRDSSSNAMGEMSYVGQFRWGPQLDCAPLNPTYGPTRNGGAVQISGEGFVDNVFAQTSPKVYFDEQEAISVSVISDTLISVTPPAVYELGIDALVSIVWGGNFTNHRSEGSSTEVYLWSSELYHFGPIFTGVSPSCAVVNGSSLMTITGFGFLDPLFQTSPRSPSSNGVQFKHGLLQFKTQNNPQWDGTKVALGDGSVPVSLNLLQVEPEDVKDNRITFLSPDWLKYSASQSDSDLNYNMMLGEEIEISVYWKQTNRWIDQPINSNDVQYQSTSLSYRLGPQINSIETSNWHYGGGDQVCLLVDCMDEYAFHQSIDGGSYKFQYSNNYDVWQLNTVQRTPDSKICGKTNYFPPCGASQSVTFQSSFDSGNVPNVVNSFKAEVNVGPVLDSNTYRVHVVDSATQIIVLNGMNINYNSTDPNLWSSIVYNSDNAVAYDTNSFTDTELKVTVPDGNFGQSDTFTVDFKANSMTCSSVDEMEVNWGPICTNSNIFHLPLSGDQSVISIEGEGFDKYDIQVLLCDVSTALGGKSQVDGITGKQVRCYDSDTDTATFETTSQLGTPSANFASFSVAGNSETYNEGTAFRGRRLWGQYFQIVAYFNSDLLDTDRATDLATILEYEFTSCADSVTVPCPTRASMVCGQVRFGPVIDGISPCQGPHGPAGEFLTTIDLSGENFDDPWTNDYRPQSGGYIAVDVSRSSNYHLAALGQFIQKPITSVGTTLTTQTVGNDFPWMGVADTKYHQVGDVARFSYFGSLASGPGEDAVNAIPFRNDALDISVFFDTCNVSMVPNLAIHWGPAFPKCPINWYYDLSATQWYGNPDWDDNCDIYGLPAWIPDNEKIQSQRVPLTRGAAANQALVLATKLSDYLSVSLLGAGQYCMNLDLAAPQECEASSHIEFIGKCYIDGVETATYLDPQDSTSSKTVVLCKIPERPFGTQANVCLRFPDRTSIDDTQLSMGEDFFDPSQTGFRIKGQDFHNYYEICVEDQLLHYKPHIEISSTSKTSFLTSGIDENNAPSADYFNVDCWGCFAYDSLQILPQFYVGGVSGTTSTPAPDAYGIMTYQVYLPLYHAEFNTDVSVSMQWVSMEQSCENGFNNAFWKVWTSQTLHFGPECEVGSGFDNLYGTNTGASTGTPLQVALTVTNGIDCFDDTGCAADTGDFNNTQNGLCLVPQPSNQMRLLYSPFDSNGNPAGAGSRTCMHRSYEITLTNMNGAGIYKGVQLTNDSLTTNSADRYQIIAPTRSASEIDCAEYSVSIFYSDALVATSDQRTVQCSGVLKWNNLEKTNGRYTLTHQITETDPDSGILTFYGWGSDRKGPNPKKDDIITVENNGNDLYWQDGSNNYIQQLDFGSLVLKAAVKAVNIGSLEFSVPNQTTWGQSFDIRVSFVSGTTVKCAVTDSKFHYGPKIISSSWDSEECLDSVSLQPSSPDYNLPTGSPSPTVDITGFGFDCCGYAASIDVNYNFGIACAFADPGNPKYYSNEDTWVPTSISSNLIRCKIPASHEEIASGSRLSGYGLFFGASSNSFGNAAEFCPAPGLCTSTGRTPLSGSATSTAPYNRFENYASKPANGVMGGICYGPKLNPDPIHLRYSGYKLRDALSSVDEVDEISMPIIGDTADIISEYYSVNNTQIIEKDTIYSFKPIFSCDYSGDSGVETTFNDPLITLPTTTFNCRTRLFAKQCGDSSDIVSFTFRNITDYYPAPNRPPYYSYKPALWTLPTVLSPGFHPESNDAIAATVEYGPTFEFISSSYPTTLLDTSINVVNVPQAFNIEIQGSYGSPYRPLLKNQNIQIKGQYLEDWIGLNQADDEPTISTYISNWGSQYAACLFGSLSDTIPSQLVLPSFNTDPTDPILLDPNSPSLLPSLPLPQRSAWDYYFTDLTTAFDSLSNSFTIECPIPGGTFDSWGFVYVLLDPHIDQFTVIYGPSSNLSPFSKNPRNFLTSYWHWTPFILGPIKSWSAAGTTEPIVLNGAGFLNYDTVSCMFGTAIATASIFNDRIVVCHLPPFLAPQELTVSLTFGTSEPFRGCSSTIFPDIQSYRAGQNINSFIPFIPSYNVDPLFNSSYEYECLNSSLCRTSFDCAGNPNLVQISNFTIAGIVDFCPKSGPVLGSSEIIFESFGFQNFESIDCTFHLGSEDRIVAATLVNSTGSLSYSCLSPSVTDPQSVLVTLSGNYNPSWTTLLGSYSNNLGSFWFDFNSPVLKTVAPLSVDFGTVSTVTITGDYFNGGDVSVSESEGQQNWNYYCIWQVPASNADPTLPLDGLPPTFSTFVKTFATSTNYTQVNTDCSFNTRYFTCLTPPDLVQFGHYYFSFVYSGVIVSQPIIFTVLPRDIQLNSVTSAVGYLNASKSIEQFSDSFELILQGSNFFGGRTSSADHLQSSICKFIDPLASDTLGPSLSSSLIESDSSARCFAPHLNIFDQMVAFFNSLSPDAVPSKCRNKPISPTKPKQTSRAQCMAKFCSKNAKRHPDICSPSISFEVALSNTAGYTWSNSLPVVYQFRFSSAPLLALPFSILFLIFVLLL